MIKNAFETSQHLQIFLEKILSKIFVNIQLRKQKNMRRCYFYNVQLEMFEHKRTRSKLEEGPRNICLDEEI